jgi:hypothetical protein
MLTDLPPVSSGPCIRGHRSTKCNHAADRLMIQVRKPGRPLSACACPPGQTCNCGGTVKVAIPRKKNCSCETKGGNRDEGHEAAVKPEVFTPAPTPSDAPASPTRPRPFRIGKGASTPRHGRLKSISPTQLDRIDPASVNILRPFNPKPMSMPMNGSDISPQSYCTAPLGLDFSDLSATGYQQSDVPTYTTTMNTMASIPSQIGHVQVMSAPGMLGTQPMGQNGAAVPPTSGSRRSCCAPKPSQAAQAQVQTPAPQPTPTPRKSCCGGGSRDINLETNMPMQPAMLSNGGMGPQFPVEQMSGQQQQKYGVPFPQGTIYYPPNYGTVMDPITPEIWANLQLQQSFHEQPDGGLPFADSVPITPHAGGNQGPGLSHQCGCGPGCSCIGCVSHPFNSQTYQHVSEAVNEAWNYHINQATADGNGHYATNGRTLPTPPPNQGQNHELETMSPQGQQAQTPSDASGLSDEQPLLPADYMWVNYPCHGDAASCLCGDDCACDGCTIHNSQLLGLNFPEQ